MKNVDSLEAQFGRLEVSDGEEYHPDTDETNVQFSFWTLPTEAEDELGDKEAEDEAEPLLEFLEPLFMQLRELESEIMSGSQERADAAIVKLKLGRAAMLDRMEELICLHADVPCYVPMPSLDSRHINEQDTSSDTEDAKDARKASGGSGAIDADWIL